MQLAPQHVQLIQRIVSSIVPPEISVLVFGSCASGQPRKYSDLDLALKGPGRVPTCLILKLYGKFEDSSLPYLVDIIDLNNVSADLANEVKKQDGGKMSIREKKKYQLQDAISFLEEVLVAGVYRRPQFDFSYLQFTDGRPNLRTC